MLKLRYKIEAGRVTIWPKSWLLIMVVALTIPFALVIVVSIGFPELGKSFASVMLPFTIIAMGIPFVLSRQQAVFDEGSNMFYCSLFNIKYRSIPFNEIDCVSAIPVTGIAFGYYFRLVLKKDRYGAGVRLSKAYSVNSKQYATWSKELMPAFNKMLQLNNNPLHAVPVINIGEIDFQFYKSVANGYITCTRSIAGRFYTALLGAVIIFAGFLGVSIPDKSSDMIIGSIVMLVGVIVLASITNKITVSQREICKSQLLGLVKTKRSTENFTNFSTLRRSTNAIYSGTDVLMNFNNEKALSLRSFYRTKKIERFIAETKKAISIA